MLSNNYYDPLFWTESSIHDKICLENGREYSIEGRYIFQTDNDFIKSVLLFLEDHEVLLISRYYSEYNTYRLKVDGYYMHRMEAIKYNCGLLDIEDDEILRFPCDLVDYKYSTELFVPNILNYSIYDKVYEVYGELININNYSRVDACMVEYDNISDGTILFFLEQGNLLGEGGGTIEKYKGTETSIKYIKGNYINTENV